MQQAEVYAVVAAVHENEPQRAGLAKLALDQIYEAINELAKLGHRISISFKELPEPVEWPKALYHQTFGMRVFEGPDEVEEAGPGWTALAVPPEPALEVAPKAPSVEAPPVVTISVPEPEAPEAPVAAPAQPPSAVVVPLGTKPVVQPVPPPLAS